MRINFPPKFVKNKWIRYLAPFAASFFCQHALVNSKLPSDKHTEPRELGKIFLVFFLLWHRSLGWQYRVVVVVAAYLHFKLRASTVYGVSAWLHELLHYAKWRLNNGNTATMTVNCSECNCISRRLLVNMRICSLLHTSFKWQQPTTVRNGLCAEDEKMAHSLK